MSQNSFNTRSSLNVGTKDYEIYQLSKLAGTEKLPFSLKILLENLLRNENGHSVTQDDINALVKWDPKAQPNVEIAFSPARVLMQDFTGVPAIVDLSAMREAMIALKGDPDKINPLVPTELVIDHSVQVDKFGTPEALDLNSELEFRRNRERYNFLKWGQNAFADFKVVPPDTGIVHQVNLEYLARVIFEKTTDGKTVAYPDTLVGTDSHTTMINGLGVLGWGVGGIEAEAAMLGQPVSMLIPKVVGFKLTGKLPAGATATDLVLMVVEILRNHGVVGKFVEFYGPGLDELPLADRATIANMAPEYGATCGIFPIDEETLKYMRLTNRSEEQIAFVKAYAQAQGMFRTADQPEAIYSENLSFDLGSVEPSLSGPKRPQDRVPLAKSKSMFAEAIRSLQGNEPESNPDELSDGSIVIAAITSCTNTSNPSVLVAAGLLAQKAASLGLTVKPWVKTSLAPGSRVVTRYLEDAGLIGSLNQLGFNVVGYGCTTCIGNSGPLPEETAKTITDKNLTVCSILSGNRNFEGRIHALIKMNYLASPPLVVAYAIAGRMDIDVINEPLGNDSKGNPVFLKDIWPDNHEIQKVVAKSVTAKQFKESYADVFAGDAPWQKLQAGTGQLFQWEDDSTYVRNPPYFDGMTMQANPVNDITDARVLALLGDSITTDHISPAGNIKADSPAGKYLIENGVKQDEFNSYGSRRGNHEVMIRGTLANIRLRNQLAPGTEGGFTTHFPSNEQTTIYDASMKYQSDNVPLIIIAGKEYGSGSSRDWAAKGVRLLGVNAVIAESYERIHRTNLVCMGVLPLQFKSNENAETIGLTGKETFSISGLNQGTAKEVTVTATANDGKQTSFTAIVRIDTPQEIEYFQNGGILQFVLRKLAG